MDKAPSNEWKELRAGPLRMRFDNGDLRYIKWGEHEILRRIYAAVRDRNWATVPSQISNLQFEIKEEAFHIAYDCEHCEGEIDFTWRGEIMGDAAGTIRFAFDGEARSTFLRNRIGFCVLHPAELAGALQAYGAPIGGGTNADFYQLNQFRPPAAGLDFVAFSMNPQMHAFDDLSLVETLTAIPHPIRSARQYFNGLPVVISPITLKPRFNAVATEAESTRQPDQLPPQVDVRQMSLCGAAWTLGAVKRLAESEAASITCYETTGWCGVMEMEAGAPLPQQFPSLPGTVFPFYHVLADVAEFAGGDMIAVQSGDALKVEAMLLEHGKRQSLLLGNLTSQTQTATMTGIAQAVRLRRLNGQNAEAAMCEPETFRKQFEPSNLSSDSIELSPFEIVQLGW